MNNKEFTEQLANRCQLTTAQTKRRIERMVVALADALEEGDTLNIPNFGTFEVKKKKERIIVNPSTRQRQLIPPKLALAFKPSAGLKEKFK